MTTFTLDTDNNVTAHDAAPAAQDNVVAFATEKELTRLSADWPITRVRRSLERLRRRAALRRPQAGQEVHRPQDGGRAHLEGHPDARRGTAARQHPRQRKPS